MTKPKTPKSKPKTPKSKPELPSISPPEPPSQAASYAHFLPQAQQLPAERVLPCSLNVNLIFANVQMGLTAVLPHLERLKPELPMLHVERFAELAPLAGALLYAAAQTEVSATPLKREQLDTLLTRLHALREPMLLCAEAYALLRLLPRQRVEQIRSGKGSFDAARDGVALADLYGEFAVALHNKHPFTPEQLTEIAELGHTLLQLITPDGARPLPSPEQAAASAARDRLYTLLFERHTDLRRAGFYLFGSEVDQLVPVLGARKGRSRSEPAPPEPGPVSATQDPEGSAAPQH